MMKKIVRASKRSAAKASAPKASARKSSPRKAVRPSPRKSVRSSPRKPARSSPPSLAPTQGLYGWITHTELASSDPASTKAWCAKVLGWTFKSSFPIPGGEYHLFAYSDQGGGGIRPNNPPEMPGTIPYIHVPDAQAAFEKALNEGAEEMLSPIGVMEGVTVAIVRAPGGVPIGFSGP
jgi:predicted enzyme related to lactoylglutathione lyase